VEECPKFPFQFVSEQNNRNYTVRRRLVITVGSGRCGTHSAARLFNSQEGLLYTHEWAPIFKWHGDAQLVINKLSVLVSRYPYVTNKQFQFPVPVDLKVKLNSDVVGDANFAYLPYVETILQRFPGTKVIALKRERQQTIDSFVRKCGNQNHWMERDGRMWRKGEYDKCFPKFNATDRKEAIGLYWDYYYREVERLIVKYPDQIRLFWTDDMFNDMEQQAEAFAFLGVKNPKLMSVVVDRLSGLPARPPAKVEPNQKQYLNPMSKQNQNPNQNLNPTPSSSPTPTPSPSPAH